jgi:hypothetical protein
LFDIDGTILSAHDISASSFGAALELVFGTRGSMETYDSFRGGDSRIAVLLNADLSDLAGRGTIRAPWPPSRPSSPWTCGWGP